MTITVLLVDDHPVFRKGLSYLLAEEPDIQVAGEAGDGGEAIEMAMSMAPDVVVMDISMPNMDGIEATKQIRVGAPATQILALSIHGEKRFVEGMLRAGAMGYMLKESAPEELVAGIRAVHRGKVYLSPAITNVVIEHYMDLMAEEPPADVTSGQDAILVTKFHPPQIVQNAMPRPRLLAQFGGWRQRPFTLVSAPAGYGKSIAVSQWVTECDCPYAWLSLDETDSDVRGFLTYLASAVRAQFGEALANVLALLKAPTLPPLRVLANLLVNDLEQCPERFILVLDDFHRAAAPEIHELLREVLRHPPQPLHLTIITRTDPAFDLLQLRTYDQMVEIRAAALSFTAAETAAYVEQMVDEAVEEDVVEALMSRTEGWVAGLRLITLSARSAIDLADAVAVLPGEQQTLDYLIAEALSHQTWERQEWLLKTSILDRFCAPLCDAVAAQPDDGSCRDFDGVGFIRWLAEDNMFVVSLDTQGQWFRYHHLFQDLLQHQLENRFDVEDIAALHISAGRWFEANDLNEEALKHALAAGDTAHAVDVVKQRRNQLMNTEQWNRLDRWLNRLPSAVVNRNPTLLITQAWSGMMFHSQYDRWLNTPDQVTALLSTSAMDDDDKAMVEAEANALRTTLLYSTGEPARAIELGEQVMRNLHPESNSMRGQTALILAMAQQGTGNFDGALNTIQRTIEHDSPSNHIIKSKMLMGLCAVHWLEGNIAEMRQPALQLLRLGEKTNLSETVSFGRYFLGCVHYLRNELAEAESHFGVVVENRYLAREHYHAQCVFGLALCKIAQDRSDEAEEVVESLVNYTLETDNTWLHEISRAFQAELALRLNRSVEADHLSNLSDPGFVVPMYVFYVPTLTAVRAMLARKTPESQQDAANLLNHLHDVVVSTHNTRVHIDVLALQALLCAARGDETTALRELHRSLDLASRGGFIRNYVDLGQPMATLLRQARNQGVAVELTAYIDQILAAFEWSATVPASVSAAGHPWVAGDELTERELQIVRLLSTELSTDEIAAQLVVSIGTVRSHSKRIYSKLDAHSRFEAVSRARTLGLIP